MKRNNAVTVQSLKFRVFKLKGTHAHPLKNLAPLQKRQLRHRNLNADSHSSQVMSKQNI